MINIPGWLSTIFFHSIGEATDGIWKKAVATSEDKIADFGKGWGDEHQLQELVGKLTDQTRPIWMDFIRWNFTDRKGLVTRNLATRRQKQLRLFLTSWDTRKEKGTLTKTVDKKIDDKTTEKLQTVERVFGNLSSNALAFVKRCVEIITVKEAEMIKGANELLPQFIQSGQLPKGHVLSPLALQQCREAGYRELVKYFEAAQLPIMPAPDENHWTGSVDAWLVRQVGTEVQPVEIVKATIVKVGAGMLSEMECDKARLAKAKSSWFAPILLPYALFRNLFA